MRSSPWLAPVLVALLAIVAGGSRAAASISVLSGLTVSQVTLAVADSHDTDPFVPNYHVQVFPNRPTTDRPVTLLLTAASPYPNQCAEVVAPQVIDQNHVSFVLWPTQAPCSTTIWTQEFHLGRFTEGRHSVLIDLYWAGVDSTGDSIRVLYSRYFDFFVWPDTIPQPPPPSTPLPYVESVRLLPKPDAFPVVREVICTGDSIQVLFAGHFPSECFKLLRIEVMHILTDTRGIPLPPLLRLIVDSTQCLRRVCPPERTPWRAAVTFGPLPNPSVYPLRVEMVVGSCLGPIESPPTDFYGDYRFVVSRCDSAGGVPCVYGLFDHPNGDGQCDAFLGPYELARARFSVKSSVALSGLQGEFKFHDVGLGIAHMGLIRPAQGMHLTWTPTPNGAKFVMFAESGAPIPASPWPGDGLPIPVLELGFQRISGRVPPSITLGYDALLGSDLQGRAIPLCLPPPWVRMRPEVARICRELDCDRNGDGVLDVRDLVLLVHCLTDSTRCDPRGADCNADSTFNLDDVLCCARRLLGIPPCIDCPDSGATRHEPIELSLGGLIESAGELRVPVVLTNAERFSAARLAIDYPAERYDVVDAGLPQSDGQWLDLHEVRDGQIVIGLIRTGLMTLDVGQRVQLQLRLRLKPGQTAGGKLLASESDFSGGDGVKLIIEHGRTEIDLAGPASIALSGARPNPFSSDTRFALTLDRTASVEIGIYDVSGRFVSSIHRGELPSGTHEFSWNGSDADGSRAATGVYFYRAAVAGSAVSRKLVLLRGE